MHVRRLAAVGVFALTAGCGGSQAPPDTAEQTAGASQPAQSGPLVPVLAKAHLADAATAAKKWQPDAVIIQVAARRVPDDGKVAWWEYGAWSPAAKTCLVITFVRGTANTQESGGTACESRPLGEIIDSDQVMTIARANGITKQDVSLVAMATPGRTGASVWSVMEEGLRNPGNINLDIDAATGKVVNTTKTP